MKCENFPSLLGILSLPFQDNTQQLISQHYMINISLENQQYLTKINKLSSIPIKFLELTAYHVL